MKFYMKHIDLKDVTLIFNIRKSCVWVSIYLQGDDQMKEMVNYESKWNKC